MVSDTHHNFLGGVAWQGIISKIEVLDTSLLLDELCKKVNIARSFLSCDRVPEPRFVAAKIEVGDGFNIGIEKGFENQLTGVLFSVWITTELCHVKHLDRRILLNDLS